MRGERRKHARFDLAEGTVSVLTAQGMHFMRVGSIMNLSEGGAAFSYDHRAHHPMHSLRLHLFGPKDSHLAVPALPCKVVFDGFSTISASRTPNGFCTIMFGHLSDREKLKLQEFIRRLRLGPLSQTESEQPPCFMAARSPAMDTGHECKRDGLGSFSQMPRILVVDDEEVIVRLTGRILENDGYRVITRTCPRAALEVFRSIPREVDLIITDYRMPLMTGAELAREVHRTRPEVPIILYSGYSEVMTDQMSRDLGFEKIAKKPMEREDLVKLVRSALDQDALGGRAEVACSSG